MTVSSSIESVVQFVQSKAAAVPQVMEAVGLDTQYKEASIQYVLSEEMGLGEGCAVYSVNPGKASTE
jgi:hypothetical protein